MSTPTEQQLRELFAADAAAAPSDVDLIAGTLRKVHYHRRVRTAWVTGLVAAVAAIGAVVATGVPERDTQPPPAAASPHSAAQPGAGTSSAPTGEGALRGATTASCVETYSPAAVAGRSFAFDGTVTAIGPAGSNRSGPPLPLAGVTFRVNQWFHGGTGGAVTIDMEAPANVSSEPLPPYGVGTRLLVSGEPRWGGAPLDAAIAWSCGFTRYYDPQTAAEWAAATR
jgi:hypothetical protein